MCTPSFIGLPALGLGQPGRILTASAIYTPFDGSSHRGNDLDVGILAYAGPGAPQEFALTVFTLDQGIGRSIHRSPAPMGRDPEFGQAIALDCTATPLTDFPGAALGASRQDSFYEGNLAEILIYDRALSCAERNAISSDLAENFGLDFTDEECNTIFPPPAFIPPIYDPRFAWTRNAVDDRNGDGPCRNDRFVGLTREGNEIVGLVKRNQPDRPFRLVIPVDNPNRLCLDPQGNASQQNANSEKGGLLAWARRRLQGSLRIQAASRHCITLGKRDGNGRPLEWIVEHHFPENGGTRIEQSVLAFVDNNNDSIADALRFEGSAMFGLGPLEFPIQCTDINGDGDMDFVTLPYKLNLSLENIAKGLSLTSLTPLTQQLQLPLTDSNNDGFNDSTIFDFDQDGQPDPGIMQLNPFVAGPPDPEVEHKLYFAQFGDGDGIFSQITLFNLDLERAADVKIILRNDAGSPLSVDLGGEVVSGEKELQIPAGGLSVLRTDGVGDLKVGSVTVCSNRPLDGVILFGGAFGVAGVGSSQIMTDGFLAPLETNTATSIDTGIAVVSLDARSVTLRLSLCDSAGNLLGTAQITLEGNGHRALFVTEIDWEQRTGVPIDFSDFKGILKVRTSRDLVATVIQQRPGEFATLPVAPRFSFVAPAAPPAGVVLDQKLYFAQFGDGDSLFSQIILLALDDTQSTTVKIILKDDNGDPLTVDLNGVVVEGETDLVIPAGGLNILSTDGVGTVIVGSVTVCSDRPLAGVILFGGGVGTAGVGSSPQLATGFLAAMESNSASGINTGIAALNLTSISNTLQLRLLDPERNLLATAQIVLPGMGHRAVFVDEIDWRTPGGGTLSATFFTNFSGILEASASGSSAATVIQTRPGVLATQPVLAKLN